MLKKRIIAVVIMKDGEVVQSEGFKHTNVIHTDAFHAIDTFNRWTVDEIVMLNVSRNRNSRSDFIKIVERISETCFVPLSIGGWIDTEDYGVELVENGADKLVINTSWYRNINIIKKLVLRYGNQCIVASVDIKTIENRKLVFIDRGRKNIDISPLHWARYCAENGAGEIFFNNIDHDGLRKGYDIETLSLLTRELSIPVIGFGGVSEWSHLADGLNAGASAVAAANIFHYKELAAKQAKRYLIRKGFNLRKVP